MREILFRAIDEATREWVYGYYYESQKPSDFGGERRYYIFDDKTISKYNVLPETVGQYTGLTDKNGKRIFEGDICQTKGFPLIDDKPFAVEWNDDECSFYWRDVLGTDEFNIGVSQNTTIIGNVHENPELLN